ncbi:MAG: hypothetical protein LBQ12_09085 [Deltaproteobacteria bacterium]|jgi:hypothetical protein|nr:hypothetical protein [Deltaproteobacteria bacterium]
MSDFLEDGLPAATKSGARLQRIDAVIRDFASEPGKVLCVGLAEDPTEGAAVTL